MASKESVKKKNIGQKFIGFVKGIIGEAKKISWPTLKQTFRNTGVVLAVCGIVGAFIWVFDLGLGELVNRLLGLGK